METEIKNAVISAASLSIEDHGLLTAFITLDYGGSCQGFGGYSLYLPKSFTHHRLESFAGHFIFRVLQIAGVERWDQLIGKTVRVKSTHCKIEAIGHIVNNDWFSPSEDFK